MHRGPAWAVDAEVGEGAAHEQLVLGVGEGVRARVHLVPCVGERAQQVLRHVLVVEGEDVDLSRQPVQCLGVVVASGQGAGDRRRAVHGVGGEHPQMHAEGHCWGDEHPGQLAGADDADDGEA